MGIMDITLIFWCVVVLAIVALVGFYCALSYAQSECHKVSKGCSKLVNDAWDRGYMAGVDDATTRPPVKRPTPAKKSPRTPAKKKPVQTLNKGKK